MTDPGMLGRYRTLFDRALGAIGYPTVEQHRALATSHVAVMNYLGGFLELGEPLPGVRLWNHLHFALQFVNNVETEAADTFRHFLDSQDPAASFLAVVVKVESSALVIAACSSDVIAVQLDCSCEARDCDEHDISFVS